MTSTARSFRNRWRWAWRCGWPAWTCWRAICGLNAASRRLAPMSELPRDSIFGVTVPLDSDERLLASLTPDAGVYWRSNGVMAVVFAGLAGVALVVMQQPAPWVGPLGAGLAIGLRADRKSTRLNSSHSSIS